ncbi:MAG TPA: phosphoglycerate dehydrogenase [Spirochaetota bacterium]|nr:phosphoglycerate dehydrogenase [Spirochaetota bacterium]HRZ26038.1 phosphoglycerate dehydrogenase [Spirochaetota bacterium]HSA14844.1 phosphoglycerate dehydrogenase [Spirochaetota bacterium]
MFKIQKLNKISPRGLVLLPSDRYEHAAEIVSPDAILVRSADMNDMDIPSSLKAVARAGAGIDNIPIDRCSEKGIVVFNTPGANANGVKELVLMALFLSSRKIYDGIAWAKSLKGKGDELPIVIEKDKWNFEGPEIKGKKLGVIGLGAIGVMVANDAQALGMDVTGYDPFMSEDAAWDLSLAVKKSSSLDSLIASSDYITLHLPLNDDTRGLIDKERFGLMKKGVRLLNFARGGLVNNDDLRAAIDQGIVVCYVTDFPEEELLNMDNVVPIPHLGASTPESEDNCAVMAVNQLKAFLEMGNITDSVNFPECVMPLGDRNRIIIANRNVPNMIGQISEVLAENGINISDMLNRSRGGYAYNIIDIDGNIGESVIERLRSIRDIIMVRYIKR